MANEREGEYEIEFPKGKKVVVRFSLRAMKELANVLKCKGPKEIPEKLKEFSNFDDLCASLAVGARFAADPKGKVVEGVPVADDFLDWITFATMGHYYGELVKALNVGSTGGVEAPKVVAKQDAGPEDPQVATPPN